MNGLKKYAVLTAAVVGLAACGTSGGFRNVLDGNDYRLLTVWPLLCHSDGSIILVQKTNPSGGFTDATETAQPCAEVKRSKKFAPRDHEAEAQDAPEADGFSAVTPSSGVTEVAAGCSSRRATASTFPAFC